MHRALFLFIGLLLNISSAASQVSIIWQKTLGGTFTDEATDLVLTNDGNCLVVGRTASTNGDVFGHHGGYDFFAAMLSPAGSLLWKKVMGGSSNDVPYSVTETSNGDFIIAGITFSNNGDVNEFHGESDGWILKLSGSGDLIWKHAMGGSGSDGFWRVISTPDEGCIIAGFADSPDGDVGNMIGNTDCWIVKLNSTGEMEWQNVFGGTNEDISNGLCLTSDNGCAVIGQTSSYNQDVSHNNGNIDFWVVKFSSTGQLEWEKSYGGENSDVGRDICNSHNGFYVTGYTGSGNTGDVNGNHGFYDIWLIKIDISGNLIWQKPIGGSQPDRAYQLEVLDDGSCIVVGGVESNDGDFPDNDGGADLALVKVSPDGELLWQKTFGGSKAEVGFAIDRTPDDGLVVAGYTWSTNGDLTGIPNKGYNDFWILKLSPETMSATEEVAPEPILLYPNPAADAVTISVPEPFSELQIIITDASGIAVLQKDVINGSTLPLTGLPAGVYTLQARMPDGRVRTGKMGKF